MRGDYQPFFEELKSLLSIMSLHLLSEDDLSASFLLRSGWVLVFSCERYYGPSWSIDIRSPKGGDCYSLWILMMAFENLTGNNYGPPTIYNQIKFLEREGGVIFSDPNFYSGEYDKINKVDY